MDRLETDILSFVRTGEGHFDELALRLFAFQFEHNRPYHAFCRAQDIAPHKITRWQDIPAVSILGFKSTELATFPVGQSAAIFESSGTTQSVRSRHHLKTLNYYEMSLKASFAKHVLPDKAELPFLILTPPPGEAPRSSLSWMMDVVRRSYGGPGSEFLVNRGRLDDQRLAAMLLKAEEINQPVALLGTTLAFLAFFEESVKAGKTYQLAPGSRIMDTGGMKSEKRETSRQEFVAMVEEILGIPDYNGINEYGMCELSSQFYGRGASSYLEGPPWVRTLVIDPATGHPKPAGSSGLLRHFDLANVHSVMAIQTEDIGMQENSGFVLQGRDPSAEVKGCSISAEAFLS